MPRRIDMKIPVEYFSKDRRNKLEARLAKFKLSKGDTIRFHEWDVARKRYTGRFYDRMVRGLHKIHHATRFWSKADLRRYGIYIFQLSEPKQRLPRTDSFRPVNVL